MNNQSEHIKRRQWLRSFASLDWYEETIKFIFNFVTKTSELLLAAGIVISTANFLTDGDVMSHNKVLSDAWSWAQALAIDSSLGIVFINAFVAAREREKIKAVVFIALTVLLATVAGLITHFDALAHATGLPVSDKSISGVVPLWIMTALRAFAVIGFLLASRLKHISLNELGRELAQKQELEQVKSREQQQEPVALSIDYDALAAAFVGVMQQGGAIQKISTQDELTIPTEVEESNTNRYPYPNLILLQETGATNVQGLDKTQEPDTGSGNLRRKDSGTERELEAVTHRNRSMETEADHYQRREPTTEPELTTIGSGSVEERLRSAYQAMQGEEEKITGNTLSRRACVRKQTALEWLKNGELRERSQQDG
jgi:hypothetical protein